MPRKGSCHIAQEPEEQSCTLVEGICWLWIPGSKQFVHLELRRVFDATQPDARPTFTCAIRGTPTTLRQSCKPLTTLVRSLTAPWDLIWDKIS